MNVKEKTTIIIKPCVVFKIMKYIYHLHERKIIERIEIRRDDLKMCLKCHKKKIYTRILYTTSHVWKKNYRNCFSYYYKKCTNSFLNS